MITINPSKSKINWGDYKPSSEFENLVYDGEGSSTESDQFIELECNGFKVVISYDLYVEGSISYEKGDYYTPEHTDVNVNTVDVTIKSIEIDGYEVELTKEMSKLFENVVKQLI